MESTCKVAEKSAGSELGIYACPACKRLLPQEEGVCAVPPVPRPYPIPRGYPRLHWEELSQSKDAVLRRMRFHRSDGTHLRDSMVSDRSKNVYGGISQPFSCQLVSTVSQKVQSAQGRVLDIAAARYLWPADWRHRRRKYSEIDVSMGNASARRSLHSKRRHFQRAFRASKSGGLPFRTRPFRRRPLLWLTSPLCGHR